MKELIERLSSEDQDRLVVMSLDSEGNSFSLLEEVDSCAWNGDRYECGLETLTPDDRAAGYSELDLVRGVPALRLWPA